MVRENRDSTIMSSIMLTSMNYELLTRVYGIGIKTALGEKDSLLRPSLSVGYATQSYEGHTDYGLTDVDSLVTGSIRTNQAKQWVSSMFGEFSLHVKLSDRISLKGSVKTIFPSSDYNEAKNNLKYSVGLSVYLF